LRSYTLGEILALNEEYRAGEQSSKRTIEVLQLQIERLLQRKEALDAALTFSLRQGRLDKGRQTGPRAAPGRLPALNRASRNPAAWDCRTVISSHRACCFMSQ
jgi:hypothetical protein